MSAWKWFERATGGMSGVVPGSDDFLLFSKRGKEILAKRPHLAWGVRNLAGPVGLAAKVHYLDQTILGGASNRTLDVLTYGRYDAGDAWDRSPKARLSRRHTHGYFVSPSDRMRRNPSQGRFDDVIADYRRLGVEWRP